MSEKNKMKAYLSCIPAVLSVLFLGSAELAAQDSSAVMLMSRADSLRKEYRFSEAAAIYAEASACASDSMLSLRIGDKLLLAENGESMAGFVSEPKVVARHGFTLDEFYLFYPLPDRSWVPVPNQLDTAGTCAFSRATFIPGHVASPDPGDKLYYSAPDISGAMNIYMTEFRDSLWSIPSMLTESMTSSADEICPMLSPDGKTMYFSSSGLYGIGGYDIYMSVWDEARGEWGEPQNMGLPFSSPADDFLYMNTADGKYTIFASNRACSKDSVYVYVLEYDPMPVRKEITDTGVLRHICSLDPDEDMPSVDSRGSASDSIPENPDTQRYMLKVAEVRSCRDSLYSCMATIDSDRQAAASGDVTEADRAMLQERIQAQEMRLPGLQDSLSRAMEELQKIEMEFLFNGVVIDPDKLQAESDREVVGASAGFAFTRMNPGKMPEMKFEVPVKKFDYSFMILPEGRFAEDNTLPDGLVYQIQMCILSSKAKTSQLKGLSPVFETRTASGKYIYRVGVFRTYNDVLARLNAVKKAGFKTAYIVPFYDGKVIKMAEAKALEKEKQTSVTYKIEMSPEGGILPDVALKALGQFGAKDIAKSEKDGQVTYVAGPFSAEAKAEEAAAAVRAAGVSDVTVTSEKTDAQQ